MFTCVKTLLEHFLKLKSDAFYLPPHWTGFSQTKVKLRWKGLGLFFFIFIILKSVVTFYLSRKLFTEILKSAFLSVPNSVINNFNIVFWRKFVFSHIIKSLLTELVRSELEDIKLVSFFSRLYHCRPDGGEFYSREPILMFALMVGG